MREYGFVVKEVALFVEADHLAAGPEARVNSKDAFLTDRRCEKELAEVLSEYADGLKVGLFLSLLYDLIRDGRFEKTLEGVVEGLVDLLGKGRTRVAAFLTEVVILLLAASFRIGVNLHIYEALFFRTKDGKKTMRGDALKRFGIVEKAPVFQSFLTGSLLCSLGHDASGPENLT